LPAQRQTVACFAPKTLAHRRYFLLILTSPLKPPLQAEETRLAACGNSSFIKPALICFNLLRGLTGKPFLGLTVLLSAAVSNFFNGKGKQKIAKVNFF
jgi:hypothetical protein